MKNSVTIIAAMIIGMAAMFAYGTIVEDSSETHVTINSIKKIADLATIEYNNTVYSIYTKKKKKKIKLFKIGSDDNKLFKDTRLLVLVTGKIKGSVDMNMADLDVDEENRKVAITFNKGAIKISNPEIASDGIETIVLRNSNIFRKLNEADRNKARKNAIAELRAAAIRGDIEMKTKDEAKVVLGNFLLALGYQSTIKFK